MVWLLEEFNLKKNSKQNGLTFFNEAINGLNILVLLNRSLYLEKRFFR